jgi:ribosomal protein S18 acetylase RimI-like enzyme
MSDNAAPDKSAPGVTFREARASDVRELGQLYALAFADNPAYAHVFRGFSGAKKHNALAWLFERRVRLLLFCNMPVVVGFADVDGGGGIPVETLVAACAFTEKSRKPGTWAMLRCGILMWPCKWGFKSLQTALQFDAKIGTVGGGELVMVAVRPGLQGRGIGEQLVNHMLQQGASEYDQVSLHTQTERNVRFYLRFGFVEVSKTAHEGGFTDWVMVRDQPRAQQRGSSKKSD